MFERPGRALVFGAGQLVEATALSVLGWSVDALETGDSVTRRPALYESFSERKGCRIITSLDDSGRRYRVITVTHVLEFIERPRERAEVLGRLAEALSKDAVLLLSMRGWRDVLAARQTVSRGDGVLTGIGTWCRGFTRAEAESLIKKAGLVAVQGPQGRRSSTPEQVRLVCKRST